MSRSNKCNISDASHDLTYNLKFSGAAVMAFHDPIQTRDGAAAGTGTDRAGTTHLDNWHNTSSGEVQANISKNVDNSFIPGLRKVAAHTDFTLNYDQGAFNGQAAWDNGRAAVERRLGSVQANIYGKAYFDLPGCHSDSVVVIGTKKTEFREIMESALGRNSRDNDQNDYHTSKMIASVFKNNQDVHEQNLQFKVKATEHMEASFGLVTDLRSRNQQYSLAYDRGNCAKFLESVKVAVIKAGGHRQYSAIQLNGNLGGCNGTNTGAGVSCLKGGITFYQADTNNEFANAGGNAPNAGSRAFENAKAHGWSGHIEGLLGGKFVVKLMMTDLHEKSGENETLNNDETLFGLQIRDVNSGLAATYWNVDDKGDDENDQAFNIGLDFCHSISGNFTALDCNDESHPTTDVECVPCEQDAMDADKLE